MSDRPLGESDAPVIDSYAKHLANLRRHGFRGPELERGAAIAAGMEEHLTDRYGQMRLGDGPEDVTPEEIEAAMKDWLRAQGLR